MEDKLLLETIERYLGGTMLCRRKAWFEQLRKNTLRLIRWFVEHRIFLHQIEEFGMVQKIKHTSITLAKTLVEKADINEGGSTFQQEVVLFSFTINTKSYGYCSLYCEASRL